MVNATSPKRATLTRHVLCRDTSINSSASRRFENKILPETPNIYTVTWIDLDDQFFAVFPPFHHMPALGLQFLFQIDIEELQQSI
jgi:hypothetical protein